LVAFHHSHATVRSVIAVMLRLLHVAEMAPPGARGADEDAEPDLNVCASEQLARNEAKLPDDTCQNAQPLPTVLVTAT
jgi:hypothetical protein